MTAVNLLRLRKEITSLLWEFTHPEAFQQKLLALFDQYKTLSFRTNMNLAPGEQSFLRQELGVPQIVIRELELALFQLVREQPTAALRLCDVLWKNSFLEIRLIATHMLGQVPLEWDDAVLKRINDWTHDGLDKAELRLIMRGGANLIRQKNPEKLLEQAQRWCARISSKDQEIGIQMMIFILEDPQFVNLPAIFSTLEMMLPSSETVIQPEMTELIEFLLQKSPIETSFFLRQMMEKKPSVLLIRMVRKLLDQIAEPSRSSIQGLLREQRRQ